MTQLTLRYDEAAYVAGFLRRLVNWDPRAAVRVRVSGSSLGLLGAPPFDCLSFVAVPLADVDGADGAVDDIVSAGRLRDVIGDVSSAGSASQRVIRLPDSMAPVPALAVVPPSGPWLPAERGIAGDIRPLVGAAVRDFRQRSDALFPRTDDALQQLADEVWDRPGWGGIPMSALHAASLHGFLPHDGLKVEAATCDGWKRLLTPGGQIFVRSSGLPPTLRLAVVNE